MNFALCTMGVVLCDQTSNYHGPYRVEPSLLTCQQQYDSACKNISVMIHIGYVSGAYIGVRPSEVWRVNPDGEIRDESHKTHYVFQMEEVDFFSYYVRLGKLKGVDEINSMDLIEIMDAEESNGAMLEELDTNEALETNIEQLDISGTFLEQWQRDYERVSKKIPELPFSNVWIAKNTASKLPEGRYFILAF